MHLVRVHEWHERSAAIRESPPIAGIFRRHKSALASIYYVQYMHRSIQNAAIYYCQLAISDLDNFSTILPVKSVHKYFTVP